MDIPGIDIPGPGDIIGGIGGFFGGLAEDAGRAIVSQMAGREAGREVAAFASPAGRGSLR